MRNKKLFYLFLILCSSFFVFTNCSDDDPQINNGVNEEEKPETPVSGTTIGFMRSGTLGIVIDSEESTYDYAFQVGFQGGMSQTDVSFVIQPWSETELDAYNAEKNSDYSLLPSNVYSMVGTVIPQGNNQTDVTVSFNPSAILSLIKETNSDYVLPLRLTSVDGDIAIDENRDELMLLISIDAPTVDFKTSSGLFNITEEASPIKILTKLTKGGKDYAGGSELSYSLAVPENAQEVVDKYNASSTKKYMLPGEDAYKLQNEVFTVGESESEATVTIYRDKIADQYYMLPLELRSDDNVLCSSRVYMLQFGKMYENPVIPYSAPDPTVIRAEDGYFYLYGTEDTYNMPIYQSKDLVTWNLVGTAFTDATRPTWDGNHSLWAPEIRYINGQYVLYYSWAIWGNEWNSNVGVAVSDSPTGPFIDKGCVIDADDPEINVQNSIDQFYYEDNGKKYLFWGSFRGIYVTELNDDGLSVKRNPDGSLVLRKKLADTAFEGTNIYKRGEYYYLFASIGACCNGAASDYRTVVGRSKDLLGPYLNKDGQDMNQNGWTLVMGGNDIWAGPGHNAIIQVDDAGVEWILYHGYKKEIADQGRFVLLDRLYWTEDGWPYVEGYAPSVSSVRPTINNK